MSSKSAQQSVEIPHDEELATTREEMDFDDPTSPERSGRVSPIAKEDNPPPPISKSPSPRPRVSFQEHADEIPPSQPPRSDSRMAQAEHTLIEAFPTIDAKVVKAVLVASGGQVEPAFNALLGMSDPDFSPETAAPPPQQPPRPARKPMTQMESDEAYARQLAQEYNGQSNLYNQREPGRRGPNSQRPGNDSDRERSFLDDDLPEIGRNIQQGFMETQKKVNNWITNFKKRLDGDEEEEEDLYSGSSSGRPVRQNFGGPGEVRGIQKYDSQRRSVDQNRYDADPHEFGEEEFNRLELRDDDAPPPALPRRPQTGPVDEVENAERNADPYKAKKWQPLTSVQPHPEDDNDPFSVGDDDEKDDKAEDVRKEDSDRLKSAARASISEGAEPVGKLQASETSGAKNAEAEKILTKD